MKDIRLFLGILSLQRISKKHDYCVNKPKICKNVNLFHQKKIKAFQLSQSNNFPRKYYFLNFQSILALFY